MLKLSVTILLLANVFGQFDFGKITKQIKNNKIIGKVVPKNILDEVDKIEAGAKLIENGPEVLRELAISIKEAVEATNKADKSINAGIQAGKNMVIEVNGSLDTVFNAGKEVVADVGDISNKTRDAVEVIKVSVGNAIKPGSGKSIVKRITKKVANPK